RWPTWAARNPAIPVRDTPVDDLAGARTKQLAASMTLGDLGAFVFGDDALDLHQEFGLRIVSHWRSIEEPDLDSKTCELVEHQDLIGVTASQAIRSEAPELFKSTGFGRVPKCVQTGPIQASSRVAVVQKLRDHLVLQFRQVVAQSLHLRADGA